MSGDFDGRSRGSPSGEEELRFIRNFHDVFLSIGLGMFIVGLGLASFLVGGDVVFGRFDTDDPVHSGRAALRTAAAILAGDAAIVWALAEVFARTRRLFLPAIVILVGFEFFFVSAVAAGYLAVFDPAHLEGLDSAARESRIFLLVLMVAALGGALAYYARTKLPFAMGATGLAAAAAVVAGLAVPFPDLVMHHIEQWQLAGGLFLFVLGLAFDARDPERRTRLSDNGFWLHFFAAPLIFFSVMAMTVMDGYKGDDGSAAAVTLALVGAFAVVSLLINRRALLVAGLLSAIAATWTLVERAGLEGAWTAASTLLLLGGIMVLLGGGWHTLRRGLVAPFPKTGLLARIIPPEPRS